jgi:hypothetical protein
MSCAGGYAIFINVREKAAELTRVLSLSEILIRGCEKFCVNGDCI